MPPVEVAVVYAGLLAAGLGALSLLRPLRLLGIATRGRGAVVLVLGLGLVVIGMRLPVPVLREAGGHGHIDSFIPVHQFGEFHQTRIHAPRVRVLESIKAVTAGEIRLFRVLTWIRSPRLPWRKAPETLLSASAERPILEVALGSGFVLLAEDPGRELVFGTVVCCGRRPPLQSPEEFGRLNGPGLAKAVMNFRLEDAADGWTRLTTETRVVVTDASAGRRFAAYWRMIYPGSALIRRMWLAAIKERAEKTNSELR